MAFLAFLAFLAKIPRFLKVFEGFGGVFTHFFHTYISAAIHIKGWPFLYSPKLTGVYVRAHLYNFPYFLFSIRKKK